MRKLLLLFSAIFLTAGIWAQTTNTFPENGNVGIGTTNPAYNLDVKDITPTIRLESEVNNATGSMIRFTELAFQGAYLQYKGDANRFDIGMHNVNSYLTTDDIPAISILRSNNNVGIGTTNPVTKLHIEGASVNWNEMVPGKNYGTIHLSTGTSLDHYGNAITWGASDAGNAQAGIYVRSDGSYGTKMYFATTDSYVTGSKTRLFIGHNGNVGIGTTSPNAKLDIKAATGDIMVLETTSAINNVMRFKNQGIENGAIYSLAGQDDFYIRATNPTGKLILQNAGSISMILDENQRVGIGTANPTYKLSVAGTISCGELIVEDVTGWADFVFEDDYSLMSLKDLDKYIQTNKHLPEIPTTAEVEENGISVGEMNTKLLQKIEELTLYTIQQQNLINNQQELIEAQEQSYNELKNEIEQIKQLIK